MAHFAYIENGVVTEHPVAQSSVIVIANSDCGDLPFPASETVGQEFIRSLGFDGLWLQTSYNHNFRKQFARKGFTYDTDNDVFIVSPWFPSWVLNESFDWVAPILKPQDASEDCYWDEETVSWVEPNDLPT